MSKPAIRKSTPVLFVDAIEPSLEFWRDRLGFAVTVEVPHGDTLGFVILVNESVEVMLQSVDSLEADAASYARAFDGDKTWLFVEVDDLAAVEAALDGCEIVLERRTTFYGAQETGYREPGGHFVTFAQFAR
jgi:catechol 2,3-dioxygenase-like lactoylglutathione lyase family enzyme